MSTRSVLPLNDQEIMEELTLHSALESWSYSTQNVHWRPSQQVSSKKSQHF